MSLIATLLANAKTFNDENNVGKTRATRELKAMLQSTNDFAIPDAFAAINEVQSIAIFGGTPSAGTFTLAFTLKSGATFTTAAIAYNANAATIQTAVNTAAAAASVTAGHIAITGGPLTTTPLTITYSGATVSGQNHGQVVIQVTGLTGGTVGAASTTTSGQTARSAWALLKVLGIVGGTIPEQGSDPSSVTAGITRGDFPHSLSSDTVKAIIEEAAIQDNNEAVKTTLFSLLGF